MRKFTQNGLALLAVLGVGWLAPLPVQAQSDQTVTLKSFDGFTQLRGRLIDFDGGTYTIETVLGVIQVDALQVACEGVVCPEDVLFGAVFGIHGSNAIGAELMPALLEGYADSLDAELIIDFGQSAEERTARIIHADGREMAVIDLQSKGSSSGFRGLGGQAAEIAMSSRRMRDRDLSVLARAGIGELRDTSDEHIIGLDGLVVVVNAANAVRSLSLEELALIYSGVVTNWRQLGGQDAPINLYARDDASGTFQTFGSLVLAPFDTDISPAAQRFVSSIDLSDSVAGDPNGIGVVGAAFQRANKALPIRQECGILSYPTTFSMKAEEYPLSRRLYLYAPLENASAHARQLVEFAVSDDAQPLLTEAGFVNQSIESVTLNEQGERILHGLLDEQEAPFDAVRVMLSDLRSAERISITLRFTAGGAQLTPKSQGDLQRLARLVASGAFDGKEILLAGFTDSVGQFALNRGLSQRRAERVETLLRDVVPAEIFEAVPLRALGYGELMPVGCNTDAQGRGANRRVEVWIRDAQ